MQSKSTKHYALTPARLAANRANFAKATLARSENSCYTKLVTMIAAHDSDECLIWPFGKLKNGYGEVLFQGKMSLAHRVAFFITYGHWPSAQTRHTCDVRQCFNPRHLIEGSAQDNTNDAISRGRLIRGNDCSWGKLTDADVVQIRDEYPKLTQKKLAAKYGVSSGAIFKVVHRKTWSHI